MRTKKEKSMIKEIEKLLNDKDFAKQLIDQISITTGIPLYPTSIIINQINFLS